MDHTDVEAARHLHRLLFLNPNDSAIETLVQQLKRAAGQGCVQQKELGIGRHLGTEVGNRWQMIVKIMAKVSLKPHGEPNVVALELQWWGEGFGQVAFHGLGVYPAGAPNEEAVLIPGTGPCVVVSAVPNDKGWVVKEPVQLGKIRSLPVMGLDLSHHFILVVQNHVRPMIVQLGNIARFDDAGPTVCQFLRNSKLVWRQRQGQCVCTVFELTI